jgi:hypothetical protein
VKAAKADMAYLEGKLEGKREGKREGKLDTAKATAKATAAQGSQTAARLKIFRNPP